MKTINVRVGERLIFCPNRKFGEAVIGEERVYGEPSSDRWLRAGSPGTVVRVVPPQPACKDCLPEDGFAFVEWASDGTTFTRCIHIEDEGEGWKKRGS